MWESIFSVVWKKNKIELFFLIKIFDFFDKIIINTVYTGMMVYLSFFFSENPSPSENIATRDNWKFLIPRKNIMARKKSLMAFCHWWITYLQKFFSFNCDIFPLENICNVFLIVPCNTIFKKITITSIIFSKKNHWWYFSSKRSIIGGIFSLKMWISNKKTGSGDIF